MVDGSPVPAESSAVSTGTYDLLLGRLTAAAQELARRAGELNQRRLDAFGSSTLEVMATNRVRTASAVVPRDVAAAGDLLLLGYNAPTRATGDVRPDDVFALHRFSFDPDGAVDIAPNPDGLAGSALDGERFRHDFDHLFTYYKQARLQQLYQAGDKLLAVFRTAQSATSLVVMRWQLIDGTLRYLDDKGQRDHRFLAPTEVTWTPATRDDNLDGEFFLVADRVLISPRRGKVRIMLDDGSAGHRPLLEEEVEREQTLEDCALAYAEVGELVLIRLRPYGEEGARHYVVNRLIDQAVRLDALGAAFRELPGGQGLIFPSGVYLRTGELRTFELDVEGMELQEIVSSPNGEDILHVFHEVEGGRSILLPYNLVRQEVVNPIWCHGYCVFDDGRMVVFREEAEPVTVHPIQWWQTPFCSPEYYATQPHEAGPLARIGNPDLVAGVGDALALRRLIRDVEPSAATFADVITQAGRVLDAHQHWYGAAEVGDLAGPTREVRTVAEEIIGQFELVQEVRAAAAAELATAGQEQAELLRSLRQTPPSTAAGFIGALSEVRVHLGRLLTLGHQREIDTEALGALVATAEEQLGAVGADAAAHLASDGAFAHYLTRFEELGAQLDQVTTAREAADLLVETDQVAADLETVTSTVGDLEIEDLPVRTAVLEQVAQVAAGLNQVRGRIETRREALVEAEHGAAFTTELGLAAQALTTSLARVTTPAECDDTLARLLGQLEALETAAPRTDAQLAELAARRDQVEETIGAKRQRLVEERLRLADQLAGAAQRNIERLAGRAAELATAAEIAGFFAADPAAQRARGLIDELRELGEAVRADELASALGRAGDDAQRALRDREELYDGDQVRFGEHRFSVDGRARNLVITPAGDELEAVVTGTDLRIPLDDPGLAAHRDRWSDPLPSETPALYRSVYLAVEVFTGRRVEVDQARSSADPDRALLDLVHDEMAHRLDEGYDRGVHDHDAVRVLAAIGAAAADAGVLLVPSPERAAAMVAWYRAEEDTRQRWRARGLALAEVGGIAVTGAGVEAGGGPRVEGGPGVEAGVEAGVEVGGGDEAALVDGVRAELGLSPLAGRYLLAELAAAGTDAGTGVGAGVGGVRFRVEERVRALSSRLLGLAPVKRARAHLLETEQVDVDGLRSVIGALVAEEVAQAGLDHAGDEVLALVGLPQVEVEPVGEVDLMVSVDGLIGNHPTVEEGRFEGRVDEVMASVAEHRVSVAPSHRAFSAERRRVTAELAASLRLDDIEPRVPEGFVRNQLITEVYLPLIGANLARQIGQAGDTTGQRSGLLMLLSPPGYGKTTLVDYLADRLGMALIKISGPSLGHDVTSLDPAQAPNAAAGQELERINLAFALGANVMLYLDDIQHTSPELLQRFISLCDAQRRIDGVWRGAPTTFDLRGKRFAVVMAGNPYTESGERFRIPDMLANRADTFNLGDVVGGANGEVFALSYLENALTANPVTAVLAGRDRGDIELLLRAAAGGEPVDESRLSHGYSSAEVGDMVNLLRHLRAVQEVVLAVNRQYIASAATDADYRTEPAFLLQGSYRNMVRMAARLLPAMTEAEVAAVVDDHYQAEAQSLTGDAEANLLRLADLRGAMTGEQQSRWEQILEAFQRRQRLGRSDDPAIQAAGLVAEAIGRLAEGP